MRHPDSGNETTKLRDAGLRGIAQHRHGDPMSSWPQHEALHLRTIMGARLFDSECLRCHLEDVSSAVIKKTV